MYGYPSPNDGSPPTELCFHFGSFGEWMVTVGGEDGEVSVYDPGGWDHTDRYQRTVATSLESFSVLLAMLAGVMENLDLASDVFGEEKGNEVRKTILDSLRARMIEYDDCVFGGGEFWDWLFEGLLEYLHVLLVVDRETMMPFGL